MKTEELVLYKEELIKFHEECSNSSEVSQRQKVGEKKFSFCFLTVFAYELTLKKFQVSR